MAGLEEPAPFSLAQAIKTALMPLASLRLTVALFAMLIFLIFAGTLAQTEKDIWYVMTAYFRTFIARIELEVFFPKTFFPGRPAIPGWIPFPGGWLIGAAMAINLLAAHGLRFKIQARGARLAAGLALVAVGAGLVWLVVASGSNKGGVEGVPYVEWSTLWDLFKVGLAAVWVAGLFALAMLDRSRKVERALVGVFSLLLGAFLGWLFYQGDDAALGDSSLRILWQLIKGGGAGSVLLAGCGLVFRKRAGIVLLHAGIGLMMANELVVHALHVEGQMRIEEGQTVNFVQDIRALELAVVDRSDPDQDDVVVVPQSLLLGERVVRHESLPFDVQVVRFLQNSSLRPAEPGEANLATAGAGLALTVDERRPGAGTDAGGEIDASAAYVKFTRKGGAGPLGTHLVGLFVALEDEQVEVDGKTYHVSLRFKRTYKPYSMHLVDVRFDKYMGTQTARNYSSELRLVDPSRNVDRKVRIWMNNPLRYAGETIYQSQFDASTGVETTGLQVVANTGWMIPYVACMIVGMGLLAHFSIVLVRFLNRRLAGEPPAGNAPENKRLGEGRVPPWGQADLAATLVALAVVVLAAGWLASEARPPSTPDSQMKLYEFGKLPLVYEGRVKPFDTLARNSLRIISDRETFVDKADRTQPAVKWLLDVIARPADAARHKVVRIENLEVLETLGLERRKGYRYAIEEFRDHMAEFDKQAELARAVEPVELSFYEKKILELDSRLRLYTVLLASFDQPTIRPDHAMEDLVAVIGHQQQTLARMQPPLAVPPVSPAAEWEPYAAAWTRAWAQAFLKDQDPKLVAQDPNPATLSLNAIFVAYAKGDARTFNREVAQYQAALADDPPPDLDTAQTNFEALFNHWQPFYHAAALYVLAFVLAALAWLGWSRPLNRAAFWLIALALAVHTLALGSRIYISGRPPVTNLYSSAVFIGWGCVILGMGLELVYRLGIGNVIASVPGFATWLIAHLLAADGDTFIVLQAVLDTQFWLATHVVCITLGYATTYVAGLLGVLYILRGVFTPSLSQQVSKELARMIYGTVSFAILFSFVGTVLGGLWADDSWGRFWGWDPKENGALIIVLWNALVLHARWGGIVRQRGLALLAVAGNIAVSWSWFGVNELGAGLHSYGFTEGVALALAVFVGTQLLVILAGSMPERMWLSFRPERSA